MSDTDQIEIRELTTDIEWIAGWQALLALRPNLSQQDFIARKEQLQKDGYHLVGLFCSDTVIAVASYTISPHPVFIREMIIHDMSTLTTEQSKGYGAKLLQFLDALAVELNCQRTFVASARAAKFYEQNGYVEHAAALKKIHRPNH